MKYSIKNIDKCTFGEKPFPVLFEKVTCLCTGTFGDFENPFYHRVLCAEWYDKENDRFRYEIIGSFKRLNRFWRFLGKPTEIVGFKSKFLKEDVEWLIYHVDKKVF